MQLAALGISAQEENVYRRLLRQPGAALSDIGGREAVERLESLGLLEIRADGSLHAVDPKLVIEQLVRQRMADVEQRLSELIAARAALPALLVEQTSAARLEFVERIDGQDNAQRRIWDVLDPATECLAIHTDRERLTAGVLERTLERLSRGVVYRTIVHRRMTGDAGIMQYLLKIHRAGDRHRVTDGSLQPLIIADRTTAFVPIEPGRREAGALMITQPGIVAFLVEHFEQTWAQARDLEPDRTELSAVERQVLDVLNQSVKDETAARAMGVSVRTFRAHVAALMARLGAANRFQAGVRAKQRGWI